MLLNLLEVDLAQEVALLPPVELAAVLDLPLVLAVVPLHPVVRHQEVLLDQAATRPLYSAKGKWVIGGISQKMHL